MIFLTVGTQKFQFNRLLQAVDHLIAAGTIRDTVIAQCGHSTYVPRNYQAYMFMDSEQFDQMLQHCDLLITHSGVGTILKGIAMKKKIIVVPRKKSLGEHVDNHQLEIANEFEKLGCISVCRQIVDLEKCYVNIKNTPVSDVQLHFSKTAKFLNKLLDEIT